MSTALALPAAANPMDGKGQATHWINPKDPRPVSDDAQYKLALRKSQESENQALHKKCNRYRDLLLSIISIRNVRISLDCVSWTRRDVPEQTDEPSNNACASIWQPPPWEPASVRDKCLDSLFFRCTCVLA